MLPEQCRAARALLGMTRMELARLAKLSRNAIYLFENEHPKTKKDTIAKIKGALATRSIQFISDETGVGVKRGHRPDVIFKSDKYIDTYRPDEPASAGLNTGLTPEQARAARAFAGLSQVSVAQRAGVGLSLLVSFENNSAGTRPNNIAKIRAMYEGMGLIFTEVDGRPTVQASVSLLRREER